MKRKLQFLTKTLLVAAGLLAGASSAWADGNKRVLNSQNYESADATDWTCPNAHNELVTGDATYGTYAKNYFVSGDGNGNRSCYKSVSFSSTPGSGFTTSDMTNSGYNIEFDFLLQGSTQKSTGAAQLIVPTTGPNLATNNPYSGSDYIFALSQANGENESSRKTGWYINDLTNNTGSTVTLSYTSWYHLKLVVTASSVAYTISNGSTTTATGSLTVTSLPTITGFFGLIGRNSGIIQFDNLEIYDYTESEVVSNPTISNPVYAGDNRTVTITGGTSSKGNSVNTYYTTNGDTPTSSSTPYTGAITITENCTLKAITISSTDVKSTVASSEITVGKLTLNAPTFTKTNYAAGKYTISIASNQTTLDYVPASTTIKYRVGTTGEFATYSTPVEVNAGKVLYAYVEADNYTTSNTSSIVTVSLPEMTRAFGQNYVSVVDEDLAMTVAEGTVVTNTIATADANYFIPSSDGTNALTNSNISFYFNYNSDNTSQNKYWTLKTTGMYSAFGRGSANVKISNLTAGQIVKVDCSAINSVSGMTKLDNYCSGTTNYYVASGTSATVTLDRYVTLYSIDVYNLDNETIGAIDMSTEGNTANSQNYTMRDGETMKFTFTNHGTTLGNNWRISVKEGETWKANVGADSYDYTANAVTKTSYTMSTDGGSSKTALNWDRYAEDMADAEVEATLTYSDGTLSMVTTSTGTANGYIYYVDQDVTSLTSNLTINISVNHSWIENLVAKEDVTVSAAGYATYVSANNLDFTSTSIKAYEAKVNAGKVVLTPINKVQAGTGVVLYKEGGATESIPVCTDYDTADDNELVAGTGAAVETTDGSYTNYILNNVSGIGFYKANAQTVASNRAYLHTLTANISSGAPLYMFFNDSETTGINTVQGSKFTVNGEYYDLQGRRVAQPTKGLYIVNGRKVVIK